MNEINNNEDIKNSMSPREVADKIIAALHSKGANDVKLLYVEKSTIIADYYIICTGNSSTHIKSLADEVEFKLSEMQTPPLHTEGRGTGNWILLDFGSVILHIFSREAREFYKLEKLWSTAEDVDIASLLPGNMQS